MQAIREMVKAKNKDCHISLPDWAVGQELEVIILPLKQRTRMAEKQGKGSLIERLLAHPLKVKGFSPLSRESAHER